MTAAIQSIYLEQGADFSQVFTTSGPSLVGASASMQIKTAPDTISSVATMTTGNGDLVIAGSNITASLPGANTMSIAPGTYYYDLKVTYSGGAIARVFQGYAIVNGEVSV